MAGLSISTTNVLITQVPTITDAGTNEVPANISDPDHSLNYTSGTDAANFTVQYGAQVNINYVAVSGHTAATIASATIQLFNGTTLIDSVALTRNNNVMFTFPTQSFSNLAVRFITTPNTYQTTVSFIAAGQYLNIETGEQGGYKRNWLNRHTVQRTSTNLQVGPVSSTVKKESLSATLSLPNEVINFAEVTWQTFIDFAFEQPFFIKEQETKAQSSYLCFDPKFDTSAHGETRNMDALNLTFTVYNGL